MTNIAFHQDSQPLSCFSHDTEHSKISISLWLKSSDYLMCSSFMQTLQAYVPLQVHFFCPYRIYVYPSILDKTLALSSLFQSKKCQKQPGNYSLVHFISKMKFCQCMSSFFTPLPHFNYLPYDPHDFFYLICSRGLLIDILSLIFYTN